MADLISKSRAAVLLSELMIGILVAITHPIALVALVALAVPPPSQQCRSLLAALLTR